MKRWLAPEMLDLHGYVTPTLIEATTKPHNPSIEYDMWLKWNQPRIDANEAALNAIGQDDPAADQRLVPGVGPARRPDCATTAAARARRGRGLGRLGPVLRPDVRTSTSASTPRRSRCATRNSTDDDAVAAPVRRRVPGSRDVQIAVQESTFEFVSTTATDMLVDELEIYRRGDVDAPRPACCPPPFDAESTTGCSTTRRRT